MARYGYFWGCYLPSRMPHLEKAMRAAFAALGIAAQDLEGLSCCPEKSMIKNADHDTWLTMAARNLAIAEDAGVAIVTPCTGCYGTLKGANHALAAHPDALAMVNARLARVGRSYQGRVPVKHVLEVLWDDFGAQTLRQRVTRPLTGLRVAVHNGCHLVRPSTELAFDDPFAPRKFDTLVEALGATSVTYTTKSLCCGGLLARADDQSQAEHMCRMKLSELAKLGVDCLTTTCPSCTMQYEYQQANLARGGEVYDVPVLSYLELLGLALGLAPEELGIAAHRVSTDRFFARWTALRAAQETLAPHFDLQGLAGCAACNGCRNDCPVNLGDPTWVPNAIIRRLAAGDLDGVIADRSAWKCHECYTCSDRCCQSYSMLEIFRTVKHLAVARGAVPGGVADGIAAVTGTGAMIATSEAARKRLKLPAVPKSGADEVAALLGER
ncbi:MAG TPA: heterodisulfide reductase-related iron-sulfur binding cluster [Armatimonadota bacterium]|nr:heterodisulfide reductase-related iron-sulfur binding cluster [Armatimonadota bacterium]HOS42281.1 heterodisulfide reductase-related iron-sulfur binding cluster [Armatimonadota bacterium]